MNLARAERMGGGNKHACRRRPDHAASVKMLLPPRHGAAAEAVREHCARATAFLVDGEHLERPANLGSGTLLLLPSGRVVLLTAKHLFDADGFRAERLRIGLHRACTGVAGASRLSLHPADDVDVALVSIPRTIEESARANAIPIESVLALPEDAPGDDPVALVGYPAAMVTHDVRSGESRVDLGFTPLCFLANIQHLRRDEFARIEMPWAEMEALDDAGAPPISLPAPTGMSGGGLWHLDSRTVKSDAVWAPAKHLRLIGVQRGWYSAHATALVDAATRWVDWLPAAAQTLSGGSE